MRQGILPAELIAVSFAVALALATPIAHAQSFGKPAEGGAGDIRGLQLEPRAGFAWYQNNHDSVSPTLTGFSFGGLIGLYRDPFITALNLNGLYFGEHGDIPSFLYKSIGIVAGGTVESLANIRILFGADFYTRHSYSREQTGLTGTQNRGALRLELSRELIDKFRIHLTYAYTSTTSDATTSVAEGVTVTTPGAYNPIHLIQLMASFPIRFEFAKKRYEEF